MYEYRAIVKSNHDGDTVTVDVDLGWRVWLHDEALRLNRINTPELNKKEEAEKGRLAKMYLQGVLPEGTEVIVKTMKDKREKYGRMLAEIYLATDVLRLNNINDGIVKHGFGLYWDGSGVRPV
jgi:micrococcal nuclease